MTLLSFHRILVIILVMGILAGIFFWVIVPFLVPPQKLGDFKADVNRIVGNVVSDDPGNPVNPPLSVPECGNGVCESTEDVSNCLLDCWVCNGNGSCESSIGENKNSCSSDCVSAPVCVVDGKCVLSTGETAVNCPADCKVESGGVGEDVAGVSTLSCGDGSCSGSETCSSCSQDCGVCPVIPVCGNNSREGSEVCDGSDLNSQTCILKGFVSGTLACLSNCTDFSTSACVAAPTQTCGNNLKEGTEACDGTDLNSQTCITLGYSGGSLSCQTSCTDFNVQNCIVPSGAIYYISIDGNDSWSGRSSDWNGTDGPWATLGKAIGLINSGNIVGGDRVLLKRGQQFQAYAIISALTSTTVNPLVIGSYGAGARPEVIQSDQKNAAIFFLDRLPAGTGITLQDLFINRTLRPVDGGWSVWIRNGAAAVTLRNCEVQGGYDAVYANDCEGYLFENNTIHGASRQGIASSCSNVVIRGNNIYNNGSTSQDHDIYLQGGIGYKSNILVENNLLHDAISCFITHGVYDNLTVRGNQVYNCNFGITIDAGYASAESFSNVTIEKNLLHNLYKYSATYPTAGVTLDSCTTCIVKNNIFYENRDNLTLMSIGGGDNGSSDVSFVNNNFYFTTPTHGVLTLSSQNISNISFKNNIIYTPLTKIGGGYPLMVTQMSGTTPTIALSNNQYYFANDPTINFYYLVALGVPGYLTHDEFLQSFPDADANSLFGQDPQFVNAINLYGGDGNIGTSDDGLMIMTASPAKNAGTTITQVSSDIRNISRPQGLAYDIGAYELSD
ncbi:MAG: right-handed parallel beta-helix repeat-containing protein [Candidatus Diapherotrites archaeon]|uniref:Right-handed parallel beta-helix repeat-containing protein n=1 Tax=Candidatus Iainarchaeum sp. TaxID=3101447 RepID=A0A8T4L2R0_9ARCH|nr:right-handed parallel beta-helix repeat-containing protein [Candidatus Diapherotrites archaeon]